MTREALDEARKRSPAEPTPRPTTTATTPGKAPPSRVTLMPWEESANGAAAADDDEMDGLPGGGASFGSASSMGPFGSGPHGVDSWFLGKVDAGPTLSPARPTIAPSPAVAIADRPVMDGEMVFGAAAAGPRAPEAPAESRTAAAFPADFALRFQSEVEDEEGRSKEVAAAAAAAAAAIPGSEGELSVILFPSSLVEPPFL
jgi:hypothetical protein